MAAPHEIRDELRRTLGRTLRAMNDPRYLVALEDEPKPIRERAAKLMLAVMRARLRVANAQLADLRDDLKANEATLVAGTQRLDASLRRLTKTREILDATAAFLRIVARLAAVAAKGAL